MTLPAVLFALIIAFLIGALFHLVRGGSFWRLLLYFGVSSAGFAAGQIVGMWRGWNMLMLGSINLGMGLIGSLLFLIAGEWLTRTETRKQSRV
jgi:hypothetical protein